MKYEVLKRSHLKKNIIIALIVVGVISAIVLNFTRAKYRTTESIPLIQGTINFSPSDLNLMAVYLNKNGETISSDKVPHVGYTLNTEQSICEVNDEKDETIEIVYENGLLNFNGLRNKGTKCTAYFDLIPDSEKPVINTINSSGDDTSITITIDATDNIGIYYYYYKLDNEEEIRTEENNYTFEGLEKDSVHTITVRVEDAAGNVASTNKEITVGLKGGDFILASGNAPISHTTDWTEQTTYYYTGKPDNWVQFAGFWWRIIRINGDGSIRMIYQGTSANETGSGTRTETSAFNSSSGNKTYVGLVYDGTNQHGYGTNSTIMNKLNTWYNNNLASYETGYIDTGAGFCSDRNLQSGSWSAKGSHNYAAYGRLYNKGSESASLQCSDVDILSQDNGRLPNPIGLITADEAALAGVTWNNQKESYLNTGQPYWTMSPSDYDSVASMFAVASNGYLDYSIVNWTGSGVRPVINLKSAIAITGSGTTNDPFKVVGLKS